MTEWLLSGHNTQESMTVAQPLTASAIATNMDIAVSWPMEALADKATQLDPALSPVQLLRGWAYINITYSALNAGKVIPFDSEAVGVPSELVIAQAKPSKRQLLLLPLRVRKLYRWVSNFYRTELPGFAEERNRHYWDLRAELDPSMELFWPLFAPDFVDRLEIVARAHGVVSILATVVDSILRQQAPELIELFAGRQTTTSLIGQRIWDLRQIAKQCGPSVCDPLHDGVAELAAYDAIPEAAPLVESVRKFLSDYGHRGFRHELDFASERMADHADHVLLSIGGQLNKQQSPQERAQIARKNAEAALLKINPLQRTIMKKLLNWGQQLIAWREASKSYISLTHALYGLVARRFSQHFYPDAAVDDTLMYYMFDEFCAFGQSQGRQRVSDEVLLRRQADFELHRTQSAPPELIYYNPDTHLWRPALETEAQEALDQAPTHYRGIPASVGIGSVEGLALVTNDPLVAARRLLEIDEPVILVTRLTDPAWSSLFAGLAGVVTELGGLVSHATIVARENGLPAVVGIPGITKWVRDGQRLHLDTVKGVVEVLG